jgi:hypothetical protein
LRDAVSKGDRRRPTKPPQLGKIEKLAWRAVRLRFVPAQFAVETDDVANQFGQFVNRNVLTATDVDDFGRIIFLEKKQTRRCAVVHV